VLYQYIYFGDNPNLRSFRDNFREFLKTGSKVPFELKGMIELPLINGIDFKKIELNDNDLNQWYDKGIVDIMYESLIPSQVRNVKEFHTEEILRNLNEPIVNLGNSLKDLALRFGNPVSGSAKKIYILPVGTYDHGLGQNIQSPDQFIKSANTRLNINNRKFYCWELDGTNNGDNLEEFNENYKDIIRAFLEGYKTLFIVAGVESGGELTQIEGISVLNILFGADIEIKDNYFTSYTRFGTLKGITFFDSVFYSKQNKYNILDTIDSFKALDIYTVPFSQRNLLFKSWNIIKNIFPF